MISATVCPTVSSPVVVSVLATEYSITRTGTERRPGLFRWASPGPVGQDLGGLGPELGSGPHQDLGARGADVLEQVIAAEPAIEDRHLPGTEVVDHLQKQGLLGLAVGTHGGPDQAAGGDLAGSDEPGLGKGPAGGRAEVAAVGLGHSGRSSVAPSISDRCQFVPPLACAGLGDRLDRGPKHIFHDLLADPFAGLGDRGGVGDLAHPLGGRAVPAAHRSSV